MPFVSQAQRAKFYATPSLHKYISEFNAATPPGPLPQHVGKVNMNHQLSRYMRQRHHAHIKRRRSVLP